MLVARDQLHEESSWAAETDEHYKPENLLLSAVDTRLCVNHYFRRMYLESTDYCQPLCCAGHCAGR